MLLSLFITVNREASGFGLWVLQTCIFHSFFFLYFSFSKPFIMQTENICKPAQRDSFNWAKELKFQILTTLLIDTQSHTVPDGRVNMCGENLYLYLNIYK